SPNTLNRVGRRYFEPIAFPAYGGNKPAAARWELQPVAQVAHVHVDDVRGWIFIISPDVRQDLLAREDASRVAYEVLEQREFSLRKLNQPLAIPRAACKQVQPQLA